MLPGDMPCNAPCENLCCRYCSDGLCTDNCPCDERTGKGSGGGYAIQRVYRYSSGKAESAPDYYKTRR